MELGVGKTQVRAGSTSSGPSSKSLYRHLVFPDRIRGRLNDPPDHGLKTRVTKVSGAQPAGRGLGRGANRDDVSRYLPATPVPDPKRRYVIWEYPL